MKWINRVSQVFQPANAISKCNLQKLEVTSKSYQLMLNAGIIRSLGAGMYAFLPLGLKVLQKLICLVDEEMSVIGGQKVLLPALTPTFLWQQTSRLIQAQSELFILNDRHGKEYVLSPTFEEAITNLISQLGPVKRNQLPLRLYQISSKWRDEMKPRLGLLRSREFIMKDMYTFDLDFENAKFTYDVVNDAYEKILNRIGIPYKRVVGDTGIIGGSISHEYHYLSECGEDVIPLCNKCKYYEDKSMKSRSHCQNCNEPVHQTNSIEIGHTFLLGTKYSQLLDATFVDSDNKEQFLMMGCYGLGLTRIIAAAIEILSTNLEIRWPLTLAPYNICIIPPKEGSKEESMTYLAYKLYFELQNSNFDVIMDDRIEMTIGRRFVDARKCGYPFVIIVGKGCSSSTSLIELHDVYNDSCLHLVPKNIVNNLKCLLRNSD